MPGRCGVPKLPHGPEGAAKAGKIRKPNATIEASAGAFIDASRIVFNNRKQIPRVTTQNVKLYALNRVAEPPTRPVEWGGTARRDVLPLPANGRTLRASDLGHVMRILAPGTRKRPTGVASQRPQGLYIRDDAYCLGVDAVARQIDNAPCDGLPILDLASM